MNRKILLFVTMFLFSLTFVSATWWNNDWNEKKLISVNFTGDFTVYNYSQLIVVQKEDGMNTTFSDIRIINEVEDTEIGYWFYNNTWNSTAVEIWINVNELDSNGKNFYIYYDNPAVATTSNITNAFWMGDDFVGSSIDFTNTYDSDNESHFSVSGGALNSSCIEAFRYMYYTPKNFSNFVSEVRMRSANVSDTVAVMVEYTGIKVAGRRESVALNSDDFYVEIAGVAAINGTPLNDVWYRGFMVNPHDTNVWTYILADDLNSTNLTQKSGAIPTYKDAKPMFECHSGNSIANWDWIYMNAYTNVTPTWSFGVEEGQTFTENSQTYNATTFSSKIEGFTINVTYDSNEWNSISGKLYYNGTFYQGTLVGTGNNVFLTRSINVPTSNANQVYSFYWNLTLINNSGSFYFKSKNYTQTVNPSTMGYCNSTLNISFINFTVYDSEFPTNKLNATFKATFNYGLDSSQLNYTYQDLTELNNSFAFCFSPSDGNYTLDASIEYESSNYQPNFYYLNNFQVSNVTQNISLYLLNSSNAATTILKVQDDMQQPLQGVYIQIQRYDVGTDTFYNVGMAKTDFNGEDVVYLNWYDTFYKYVLTQEGNILLISNTSKISDSPVTFTLPTTIAFDYTKFLDITYSLTYNNATKNFILTYSIPSGGVSSMCLRVDRRTAKNDTLICNNCETSSSATLYCNINAYGNGTYIATAYATGSLGFIESLVEFVGVVHSLYEEIGNVDGSIYAFLFAGIVMTMFFVSPVLGVVGAILGIIGSMALGFQPLNYFEFLGIVIVGVVIILILKR